MGGKIGELVIPYETFIIDILFSNCVLPTKCYCEAEVRFLCLLFVS